MSAMLQKFSKKQVLILAALAIVLLLPPVLVAQWVHSKHTHVEQLLEDLEPRYARLLALQMQKQELHEALEAARAQQSRVLYPAAVDAGQIGNSAQSGLRALLVKTGLTVASSEVKVEPQGDGSEPEKIHVYITADGTLSQIHQAILAVHGLQPRVWLEELQISGRGNVLNTSSKADPVLSVRMFYLIPRSKGAE